MLNILGTRYSSTSAYINVDELLLFTRLSFDFKREMEGYYLKIVIGEKVCDVLILSCRADELWQVMEEYDIKPDGAFIWDIQSWSMSESLKNVNKDCKRY